MPGINGVDLCKIIKAEYPEIKILILSMIDEINMVQRMIKYGADGYLLKNSIQDELLDAVKAVAAGKKYYNKRISHLLNFDNAPSSNGRRESMRPSLSRREKEVLSLVVKEFSTPEIAKELFISEGTVITHRKHILRKMGVKNAAGAVRVAIDWGLV